ncbi:MAG: glycosyltransferase family 1 protein [Alphaproteobacteria bacterium]|nr:glycosyltransferase family 1 protein [Alphaproteobacteria bacterium]
MKLQAGHKTLLVLAVLLTAVVLCTLPFRVLKQETLYVYTKGQFSSAEAGFIDELKRLGFAVKLNVKELPKPQTAALWLDTPNAMEEMKKSQAEVNFIYTTAYYPLPLAGQTKALVVLTPYRELYEHYVRFNQKTALFSLGINLKDFYNKEDKKIYTALYYGDNNKVFPYAEALKQKKDIRFMGDFWPASFEALQPKTQKQKADILNQTDIVIVYNAPASPQSKTIPTELAEAAGCATLVFSTPNSAVSKLYGNTVITYDTLPDLEEKLAYYLNKRQQTKHIGRTLQKITIEKYSSAVTAKRFKEILNWLKQNSPKPALR